MYFLNRQEEQWTIWAHILKYHGACERLIHSRAYFHSFMVHLDGISLLKPIIDHNMYLSSISQSRNNVETWLCTKWESRLLPNRTTPFSQVVAHTCSEATLFSYPITVLLIYRLPVHITNCRHQQHNFELSAWKKFNTTMPTAPYCYTSTWHYTRAELDKYKHDACKKQHAIHWNCSNNCTQWLDV